jgi:p-aminobenzoyl-glutamate transporter AbgT
VSDEPPRAGVLDWIERAGNALPDPATLFAMWRRRSPES